ncbi:hypothetical protein [Microvirga makkahensis]|uniref:Uncharacterized protein n=1 Tax=Microvirga makkahensis TaxID=1128670 RepID=A0A7X3MNU9_9HYPH|nr:hypothetical protein [Microvirga makkahensis]MXQ10433.1 hypothetical protein [Microvirga makkahensis]
MTAILQHWCTVLVILTAAIAPIRGALGQGRHDDSPFAPAEMIPERPARCHEIKEAVRDVPTPAGLDRIDFSAVGALSLVHFDGVLAYMGICSEPDAKVLCVTYSTNDLKVGDVVIVTGSYSRMAPNYVVLDPCLTRRLDRGAE